MKIEFSRFEDSFARVTTLIKLSEELKGQNKSEECDDILRSCIVLLVSALDFFIHEFVRIRMIEIFKGERTPTPSYKAFKITLGSLPDTSDRAQDGKWLENEITKILGYQSFQAFEKVGAALKLVVGEDHIWQKIAENMSLDQKGLKSSLNSIVDRRQKIAHEADRDPSYPDSRWPIYADDVKSASELIKRLVEAIIKID